MKVVVVMKVSVLRYFKLQLACGINLSRKREKRREKISAVQCGAIQLQPNPGRKEA